MKFTGIAGSNVIRYVNFDAIRFLWIDEMDENFCKENGFEDSRYSVMAEHDIYLKSFPTRERAEQFLAELVTMLNGGA